MKLKSSKVYQHSRLMLLVGAMAFAAACSAVPVAEQQENNSQAVQSGDMVQTEGVQPIEGTTSTPAMSEEQMKSQRGVLESFYQDARIKGFNKLFFKFDSSELTSEDIAKINETLVPFLLDTSMRTDMNPEGVQYMYVMRGYADTRGSENYNMKLSQRRADAVREALVAAGVNPDHLVSIPKGEDVTHMCNENTASRSACYAEERRVMVDIMPVPPAGVDMNAYIAENLQRIDARDEAALASANQGMATEPVQNSEVGSENQTQQGAVNQDPGAQAGYDQGGDNQDQGGDDQQGYDQQNDGQPPESDDNSYEDGNNDE